MNVSKLRVIELLLWSIFLGSIITSAINSSRNINYPLVQFAVASLLILSFKYFKYIPYYTRFNKGYWFIYPMLIICVYGTILGRLMGAYSFSAWIFDSLFIYAGALLILLSSQENIRNRLLVIFKWQFIVAILFGLYALLTSPSFQEIIGNKMVWVNSYEKPALTMLALAPFFLGFVVKKGDKITLLIAILGYVVYIVIALRGTVRTLLIVNFLIIPLAVLAVNWQHRGFKQIYPFIKTAFMIGSIIGIILLFSPDYFNRMKISNAFSATLQRLTGYVEWVGVTEMKVGLLNKVTQEATYARGGEAKDFINSLNWFEYIFGKGFGMLWYSEFWGKYWPLVHSGPFHLIFRGGIPLLITYYLIFFSALKVSWRNSSTDPIAMGCFVYLVSWGVKFLSYGADQSSYYLYVFWLVIGLSFSTDIYRKSQKSLLKVDNV